MFFVSFPWTKEFTVLEFFGWEAFESRDHEILSQFPLVDSKWILGHLEFVPYALKFVLFFMSKVIHHPIFNDLITKASSTDVLFCISESLIRRQHQEQIGTWLEILQQKKYTFGMESQFMGKVVQHYLQWEENLKLNEDLDPPVLTQFEQKVISFLSAEKIRCRTKPFEILPYSLASAFERSGWVPGKALSGAFVLSMSREELINQDECTLQESVPNGANGLVICFPLCFSVSENFCHLKLFWRIILVSTVRFRQVKMLGWGKY